MFFDKKLKKFLFSKGLLTIAINRTKENIKGCNANYYKNITILIAAFVFSETLEGRNFWYNIHTEYEKQKSN
jgi:hypothetical protein